MIIGALGGFVRLAFARRGAGNAYERLRQDIGRAILLGLEVLIIADIIRTIVVEPTFESVTVLGVIVVIRIPAELLARSRDRRHLAVASSGCTGRRCGGRA